MTSAFFTTLDPARLRELGKAARRRTPWASHAVHQPRPAQQAVDIVLAGNEGRLASLVPLRMGRMSAGPFAFLRGAAAVMAHDLNRGPATEGLHAQICGDAHVSNFGFFASPERRQVMDLNDFDETVVGPFEYDLKRLAASIVVCARESGHSGEVAGNAVYDAVKAYRGMTRALAGMRVIDAWSLGFDETLLKRIRAGHLEDVLDRVVRKAAGNNSVKVARKAARKLGQRWEFDDAPPLLARLAGEERQQVIEGLERYVDTIPPSRAVLLSRYRLADIAFRVVGVGSVGTRAYIALLHGSSDDPLVLQIKEARPSVYAASSRCRVYPPGNDGERVVFGQQIMQTVSDPLLGWTKVAGRPAMVRTFRDLKGSIDASLLAPNQLDDYARICAALLARAHARSVDAQVLSGYLGSGEQLATHLISYGYAYADQTEADYEAFSAAVRRGSITVMDG